MMSNAKKKAKHYQQIDRPTNRRSERVIKLRARDKKHNPIVLAISFILATVGFSLLRLIPSLTSSLNSSIHQITEEEREKA